MVATKIRASQTDTDSAIQTLTNKTLTSPKLNEAVALTSTSTELNLLHGQLGAWTSFTPSWTNVTIGNATITARYCQIGKVVFCSIEFAMGSTTSITGYPIQFSLPVTAKNGSVGIGNVYMEDAGVSGYTGVLRIVNTASIALFTYAGGVTTSTVPFTWATGDLFKTTFTYEAA